MKLTDVVAAIEAIAADQPNINTIVENDIFKLDDYPDIKYGVFGFTQGEHTASAGSDFLNLVFTFFHIDKLTDDKSNMLEIHSTGIQTLGNIIHRLDEEDYTVGEYAFQPFTQTFKDECAGVYCTVSLQIPKESMCGISYDRGEKNIVKI